MNDGLIAAVVWSAKPTKKKVIAEHATYFDAKDKSMMNKIEFCQKRFLVYRATN